MLRCLCVKARKLSRFSKARTRRRCAPHYKPANQLLSGRVRFSGRLEAVSIDTPQKNNATGALSFLFFTGSPVLSVASHTCLLQKRKLSSCGGYKQSCHAPHGVCMYFLLSTAFAGRRLLPPCHKLEKNLQDICMACFVRRVYEIEGSLSPHNRVQQSTFEEEENNKQKTHQAGPSSKIEKRACLLLSSKQNTKYRSHTHPPAAVIPSCCTFMIAFSCFPVLTLHIAYRIYQPP